MDTPTQDKANGLESILPPALRSHTLSKAERFVLQAAPDGYYAICGPSDQSEDLENDPSYAEKWGPERAIRAELIHWLCSDTKASRMVHANGVSIFGARIDGQLFLSDIKCPFGLALSQCRIMDPIICRSLTISYLQLLGSQVSSIDAEFINVTAGLYLSHGFSATGIIDLYRASIGGDLNCEDGKFTNSSSTTIKADLAEVRGAVFFTGKFASSGKVSLISATIHGSLYCQNGQFINPQEAAIDGTDLEVNGSIFLSDGFSARGIVNLYGAKIRTDLDCGGGSIISVSKSNQQWTSLAVASTGIALNGSSTTVNGSIFLRGGFVSVGQVFLLGAQITGDLDCDGGSFSNLAGESLNAERVSVGSSAHFRNGFAASGQVNLRGIQVTNTLECQGGSFETFTLAQASVKNAFMWADVDHIANLDLSNTFVGELSSDKQSWPGEGNLEIDGFVYGAISDDLKDHAFQLEWLKRDPSFSAQPYRQLAKVLRDLGDQDGEKQVLMEMERRSRKESELKIGGFTRRLSRSAWDELLGTTVGFGIYPERAIGGITLLAVLGLVIHRRAEVAKAMAPTDKDAYKEFRTNGKIPDGYPPFSPLVYTIENCIPLVKFGQDDRWQPDPNPAPKSIPRFQEQGIWARLKYWFRITLPTWIVTPQALRGLRWTMIALGWVLATFFVAGLSGLIKSN